MSLTTSAALANAQLDEETSSTVPFTWTTSDWWSCVGCYEAAT